MKKTRFLSSVLVLCLFGMVDAFAAPTVKRLGSNTARVGSNASVVTSKPSVSANNSQRLSSVRSQNVAGGAANTLSNTVSPAKATGDEARLGLGKYIINPGIVKTPVTSTGPNKAPGQKPDVSSEDLVNLTDRVSDVENKMDLKQEKISAGEGLVLENNTISIDENLAELPNRVDTLSDDIDGLSAEMETKVSGDELDEFATGYYTKEEIDAKVEGIVVGNVGGLFDGKQDTITDLNDIRSGAASGKTAVQPETLNNYLTTTNAAQTYQPIGNYATTDSLGSYYTKDEVDTKVANIVAGDMGSALEGKQDTITDLAAIRSGAQAGNTAVQPETLNNYLTTTNAAQTYQPIGNYATADALNAKADAAALNNYLTATNAAATYQPIGNYATVDALNAKLDAADLSGYLTTVNAAQTYQPKGNYLTEHQDISGLISNPTLPSWSGDYVLKVNVSDSGNYTYSWAKASDYSGGGSSGGGSSAGGSNDDCDPNWEVCD